MRFPLVVCLLVPFVVITVPSLAQSPNGNINGFVSDPTNAAVSDAEIVAANDVTGVQYTTKTNSEGIYILPSLPPGPYRIQVSKIGFKTLIKPDIVLNVQDSLAINFTLLVGAFHEIVTVQGGSPLVNTESASVSTVIDQTYVKNMPLNGRSFQDLILLTPGVVTQTPQISQNGNNGLGMTGEFSVNGQRIESNYYTVDGVSANVGVAAGTNLTTGAGASGSLAAATALGTTQALVSVDDLQEFRVQSSTYSAEYGRNPGGQFAFETKSGTNQWRGSAYEYLRNSFFDARDWFNDYFSLEEPTLHQSDFGGTLGGPVEIPHLYDGKNQSFFFFSFEGLRLAAPRAATATFVPDLALRARAPAALQQALNAFAFPTPGGVDDSANGIAQYIASWSTPASLNSTSIRFDHVISDKLRLSFRYSDTNSSSATRGVARGLTPTDEETLSPALRTYTAAANSILATRLTNEFHLNYSSNHVQDRSEINALGGSSPVDLLGLSGLGVGSGADLFLFYGGYFFGLQQYQQSGQQKQWNLLDTFSLSLGHHQVKFGADYRRLTPVSTPYSPALAYYYDAVGSIEANSPSTFLVTTSPAYPLYLNFSAFAEDQWRVSPSLVVSFGLRWEVNPAPGVTQGVKPYTLKGGNPETWALAPEGTPLWRTTWYNFAPRLGTAYVLHHTSQWETVVRGGVGVFFDTGQQLASGGFLNGPGFSAEDFPSGPFPVDAASQDPVVVNPPSLPDFGEAYGFAPHLQLPYTIQWNVSLDQALSQAQSFTASYVGSHASRLLQENEFEPANNPNAGFFILVGNGLSSDYDALEAQFKRRLSGGLTALGSYTWSHCLDFGSQNYFFAYQHGNCDFDVRHSFSGALSYDVREPRDGGFMRLLLQHWGVDGRFSARTAFPLTLTGLGLVLPNGQVYDEGLSFVPGQPVYLYGSECSVVLRSLGDLGSGQTCPGGRALNPNAFANVSAGLGNAPRNFARGFGAWQGDFAIRREFSLGEKPKLQFRAEAFNLFNHPNFGTINTNFGQSTFGQATATLANSLGVLSPLYQMGGPRSMQFAVKLLF